MPSPVFTYRNMDMDKLEYIGILLAKYHQHQLTDEEQIFLEEWARADPANQILYEEFAPDSNSNLVGELHAYQKASRGLTFDTVLSKSTSSNVRGIRKRRLLAISAAACLLAVMGFWSYKYLSVEDTVAQQVQIDLQMPKPQPGKIGALLVTDNGMEQEIAATTGINFDVNGQLLGDLAIDSNRLASAQTISLIIPKGNNYTLVLSDGTKVWMNSNSKISFPKQFKGDVRQVTLEGEAYFEVSSNRKKPFIVHSAKQDITVLGTHFNVKCYPDDQQIMTTLFEGSVRVKDSDNLNQLILSPGEESLLGENKHLTKRNANLEEAAAWRNGLFSFQQAAFGDVLKQISRWYNVEVVYKGSIPNETFTGEVNRNVDFDLMLQFLKGSGIHVEYRNGQLIIH